jgi:hypothetical protein
MAAIDAQPSQNHFLRAVRISTSQAAARKWASLENLTSICRDGAIWKGPLGSLDRPGTERRDDDDSLLDE